MGYTIGDRITLQSDVKTHASSVKAGTVCTIVVKPENKENEVIIVKTSNEEQEQVVFGAATSLLRKATDSEIENSQYKDLVAKNFWIGEVFKVSNNTSFDGIQSGSIGTITNVKLKSNESNDTLCFEFGGVDGYEFSRQFVEMNFDKYDKEVEDMLGDEVVIKGSKRNYHLPGARMILNEDIESTKKGSIVILLRNKNINTFEIENLMHEKFTVNRDQLTPITDGETFMQYQEDEDYVIPLYYRTGSVLIANQNISKHALLNKNIKPDDFIEILNVSGININVFEDVYLIGVNNQFDQPLNVTYSDLKTFFIPHSSPHTEAQEESGEEKLDAVKEEKVHDIVEQLLDDNKELDLSVFNTLPKIPDEPIKEEFSAEFEKLEEFNAIPIIIHELSILDFRFKINHELNSFIIDDSNTSYHFEQINDLIVALQELKKLNKDNIEKQF